MFKPVKAALSAGLALLVAASTYNNVGAQAYTTQFITSITYQNVGSDAAKVELNFYGENSGTPTTQSLPDLAKDAGASFYVGNASNLSSGFKGAAVLSSGQPIIATMVQVPQNSTTVRNRPLSNGFDGSSGAANVRIATVLKNTFDQNTQFSVQNVDSAANNLEVKFINADAAAGAVGSVVKTETVTGLPVNSVKYFDANTLLTSPFNGSVTIKATRSDGSDGKVVATALELNINGAGASAFEGLATDGNKFYMPSAICNAFGGQSTAYAIQNTDASASASVKVTYTYRSASAAAGDPFQTIDETKTIAAGAKASFQGCSVMPANSNGSAVIDATGAKVVAIGKVFGAGLSTAAPGAAAGSSKLALPYVRYTADATFNSGQRQRTFIAIQNVGAALNAGDVKVKYVGRDGSVLGTHTLGALAANSKLSSNATLATGDSAALAEFGYYSDGFGGSAIIEGPAGSQLVVVARVQSVGVGEDYNGIPVQ